MIHSPSSARRFHPAIRVVLGLLSCLLPLHAAKETVKSPMLRIVCVAVLGGQGDYVLASQDEKGAWQEHQNLKLRSTFITPWFASPTGKLGLCVREEGKLVSKCSFTYPAETTRALLILLPDAETGQYKAQVIDAAKQAFGKGQILLMNLGAISSEVEFGESNRIVSEPGGLSVVKPSLDKNGMYRILVTYKDKEGKVETCYDRFIPGNDTGRDLLFLIPAPNSSVGVSSLTDFGPFE